MTEVTRGFCWHQNFVPWGCLLLSCGYKHLLNHEKMCIPELYTCIKSWKNCIKSDFKEIFLKLVANDQSDKRFLLTSKFCSLGLSAPDLRLYTFIKSWKDVYEVRDWRDFFLNLQQMTIVIGLPDDIKILVLMGCLPRAMYMYKIMKNVHKIRGHGYFLKHATSDQSDKTFLLA